MNKRYLNKNERTYAGIASTIPLFAFPRSLVLSQSPDQGLARVLPKFDRRATNVSWLRLSHPRVSCPLPMTTRLVALRGTASRLGPAYHAPRALHEACPVGPHLAISSRRCGHSLRPNLARHFRTSQPWVIGGHRCRQTVCSLALKEL